MARLTDYKALLMRSVYLGCRCSPRMLRRAECSALLADSRAYSTDIPAFWTDYRALFMDYTAVLMHTNDFG